MWFVNYDGCVKTHCMFKAEKVICHWVTFLALTSFELKLIHIHISLPIEVARLYLHYLCLLYVAIFFNLFTISLSILPTICHFPHSSFVEYSNIIFLTKIINTCSSQLRLTISFIIYGRKTLHISWKWLILFQEYIAKKLVKLQKCEWKGRLERGLTKRPWVSDLDTGVVSFQAGMWLVKYI